MLGDHIRALKDGRWQHAIDLGDQRVLFLVEQPGLAPGDRLRRVYRPEFTAGASRVELVVHRERTYPAKAVVARAWSRFMDPSVVSMFHDSQQFAAWCKAGRLPEPAPDAPPAAGKRAGGRSKGQAKAAPPKKRARGSGAARPAARKKAAPAPKRPAARPARAVKRATPKRKPAARKAAARKGAASKTSKRPAAKRKGRR
jgi:hypothetical protein